ncbi:MULTISPECIES: succinate dehydrogenase cytochrome b556 subunit [Corallincola]|uniref:Succinate dehydrogenase cytochrome b556 subunit n=3 Tax=Corallincola TaxID=1775176 RepID=A0A368NTQ0_9GAMM|nr:MULTISPECIES: succinate dehydrogenase cytochrome b556 subunit [Corallincola]RCU52591.1 succinate dehydrogenase cytochrome b556 subunit [Corallincola holothuriorum]TAA48216.1 succinate dehydrogenase cytochrome b556 subunit [Corallincola spongiicola]TCI02489.1 succinate dehydrogenase cytochrome b556 subunit [Corallincola luteus]
MKKQRPVNLDLATIRFPATAIASILHRVSGVIMFVAIAILLWLLNISLTSESGFNEVKAMIDGWFVGFVLWGILTALAYHFVGGIRHLLQDLGYFEELESGIRSAHVGFALTAVLSVLAGVWVW